MPTLKKFRIQNFRGIQDTEIGVDHRKRSDVITLIGLNESGKTTILEALSHFSTGDRTIPNLIAQSENKEHLISLIPIDKRAAFTGDITISAKIGFEKGEFARYVRAAEQKYSIDIQTDGEIPEIEVSKEFSYKDSIYTGQMNYWNGINFSVRRKGKRKFEKYVKPDSREDNIWHYFVDLVEKELFELVYFPTFIVDMPARIYLEEHDGETGTNLYYRKVIEDVLRSIGEGIDLKRHVVDRLKEAKRADATPNWFSIFFGRPERSLIDSVLNKIQAAINKEVIGSWSKVFNHAVSSRSVKLEWNVDAQKKDMVYLSFAITDGQSTFSIHERSLGFRWFFSYLLFTQFRSKSGKKTIFLFDEPAANLHAKAQMQLIESIARIVDGGNKVIYSTHSPHMINPAWLSAAFIVENKAVDLDQEEDVYSLDARPNDIKAIGYGDFVSLYPEKTTYFQPVWEKLLYEVPPLAGNGPFLCFEGISDFHFFFYAMQIGREKYKFSLVPGVGAGGFINTLPSLYGVGANFILVLDDDTQGKKERDRYINDGILASTQVFTLANVDPSYSGRKLEQLLSDDALALVKARFSGKCGKKQIGMYLAEIAASGSVGGLDDQTLERAHKVLNWAALQLQ